MSWEVVDLPAVVEGRSTTCSVSFTSDAVCVVEVRLAGQLKARGEGSDLFEALASARRLLEGQQVMVGCNGCRRDVFPSPMLRQATKGRRAYVLELPRSAKKPPMVDIFEAVSDLSTLGTVDEQRRWFDHWLPSDPGGAVSF